MSRRQQPAEEVEVSDQSQDAQRVYQLTLELKYAKRAKKEANRMNNEEVKRIQAEIEEIINRENQPEQVADPVSEAA